jgi:hypothetical protein
MASRYIEQLMFDLIRHQLSEIELETSVDDIDPRAVDEIVRHIVQDLKEISENEDVMRDYLAGERTQTMVEGIYFYLTKSTNTIYASER